MSSARIAVLPVLIVLALAGCIGLAAPALARAAATFDSPVVAGTTGTSPIKLAAGDLNGDGRTDFATADAGDNQVTVIYRNAANTGYDPPVVAGATGDGTQLRDLAVGDVTGDGRLDIVTVDATPDRVSLFARNAANTGFEPRATAGTTGMDPEGVAIGDLNGDSRNDIATADTNGRRITVITRNAAGTAFDASVSAGTTTGRFPSDVAIGDVNADGRNDLATADRLDRNVTVVTRNATNTGFDAPVNAGTTGAAPVGIAIGDLDGDGRGDVVTANLSNNNLTVLRRNTANSGFDAPADPGLVVGQPSTVAVGDLDGDGRLDLATNDPQQGGLVYITRNAANTGYDPQVATASGGAFPNDVVIADTDGDGRPDLASADPAGAPEPETVRVYRNVTVFPDASAPTTTDDVPATRQPGPVAVTLTATDSGGSGVASIKYEIGVNPATPTAASATYDPANKPRLRNGERIRYFATDNAGNAETPKTSIAATVDEQATGSSNGTTTSTGTTTSGGGSTAAIVAPSPSPTSPVARIASATLDLGTRSIVVRGRTVVGCATLPAGPIASCSARIVDATGTVLSTGGARTASAQATSADVALYRTRAGRLALRARPEGVNAFVELAVVTENGTVLTRRLATTFVAANGVVVPTARSAKLDATSIRQITTLARIFSRAKSVSCRANTDRRAGTTAAQARAATLAQAEAACALVKRFATGAKTTAKGEGQGRPRASNDTAAGRKRNVRVVLTFTL